MTNEELRNEVKFLREKLLGVRLIAQEMNDELECVRHQMAKLALPVLQQETEGAMLHLQDMINTLLGDIKR